MEETVSLIYELNYSNRRVLRYMLELYFIVSQRHKSTSSYVKTLNLCNINSRI